MILMHLSSSPISQRARSAAARRRGSSSSSSGLLPPPGSASASIRAALHGSEPLPRARVPSRRASGTARLGGAEDQHGRRRPVHHALDAHRRDPGAHVEAQATGTAQVDGPGSAGVRPPCYASGAMADQLAALPRPRESFTLLCVRCGSSLFYVRQDRARGVLEHHFACPRCGQKHAAWSGWDPHRTQVLG